MVKWIIDLESFMVETDTEDEAEAERKAKEYLAFRPSLRIENITKDEYLE